MYGNEWRRDGRYFSNVTCFTVSIEMDRYTGMRKLCLDLFYSLLKANRSVTCALLEQKKIDIEEMLFDVMLLLLS